MKLFFTRLLLFVFLVQLSGCAQETVLDDFTAGLSADWNGTATFGLSVEDDALRVDYNRTAVSGPWDLFSFKTEIAELDTYRLILRIRSTTDLALAVKPVYAAGDDWLTADVVGGNEWAEVKLSVEQDEMRTLDVIYFYFDRGSTAPKRGTVYIDYIKIDRSASKEPLETAVANARKLRGYVQSGSGEGQADWSDLVDYETAIETAEALLTESITGGEVRAGVKALNDATTMLEAKIHTHAVVAGQDLALPDLSYETRNLYANLKQLAASKFLFGMQDATGYGVGWNDDNDRSDVKDVTGSYPALGGWGMRDIANGGSGADAAYRMRKFFDLGGLNTAEWHADNPYGGKREVGSGKSEVGSQKSEVRSQKSEVRSRESEVGSGEIYDWRKLPTAFCRLE